MDQSVVPWAGSIVEEQGVTTNGVSFAGDENILKFVDCDEGYVNQ